MARYTCSYQVPLQQLQSSLREVLQDCHFDIIYDTSDYLMARETPGRVAFAQLVTAEILIDNTNATPEGIQIDLVIKNEELPLQVNNHCRQMYDLLQEKIAENCQWQLIANVVS